MIGAISDRVENNAESVVHLSVELRWKARRPGRGVRQWKRIRSDRLRRMIMDTMRCRTAGVNCGSRSEEHTSELQSLMRISYAVFCLKKKTELQKNIQCK